MKAILLSLLCVLPAFGQVQALGGVALNGGPIAFLASNDNVTGTTINQLAKINASGNAVLATTGDTAVPIYIVVSGAGTSGSAALAIGGFATCRFDASGATIGHFVAKSTAADGVCKDAGATAPTSGWIIGQVRTSAAANATATVALSGGYNSTAGGGGGGAITFSQLGDYAVAVTSATVETIGTLCSSANPCSVGNGPVNVCALTAPATASLSGTSVGGTNDAWWYCTAQGILTVGHNTSSTISCSAGCAVATGVTGFPSDSTPIQHTSFTSLQWNAIVPATAEKRAALRNTPIAASSGVSTILDPTTGILSIATDPTIVPRWFKGSGSPNVGPLSCTQGRDFYTDTASPNNWFCSATNTWSQSNAAAQRTDIENFPLGGFNNGGVTIQFSFWSDTGGGSSYNNLTGPNSIAYKIGGIYLNPPTGNLMVTKKASHTWSAAAGTVDVSVVSGNIDGAPGAGSWNLNFYVGCAGVTNGTFTYGTVTTLTVTPVSAIGNFTTYTANGLNLPGSCAADSEMQFWVQRTADTGGTTGVHPFLTVLEVVIRGN